MTAASGCPRSPTTAASSPSSPVPRTWSRTTTTGSRDFFVRDLKRGETTRVSVSSAGAEQTPGPGAEELGIVPALSANGRFVAFFSASPNLVPNDHNGTDDIFVRDRKLGETTRVSVSSTGEEANDTQPLLSLDLGQRALRRLHVLGLEPGRRATKTGTPKTSSSATESGA